MNLTDTHCHLDLEKFDSDRQTVINRAWETGLTRILIPGINLASSERVVALAKSDPRLFAAIGVHPGDAQSWQAETANELKKRYFKSSDDLKSGPFTQKIVAIGEIGLDYYWDGAPNEHQQMVLKEQLTTAAELCLPVILHMREKADVVDGQCAQDLIRILQEWVQILISSNNPLAKAPGVLHSFSGSSKTAQNVIGMNFMIGITGPITYKNAESKREVVKSLPLEYILTETDSPYLAPVPKRGFRNEPAFIYHITDKIAEIHNKNPEEIAALTSQNAARLFSWGG